MDGEINISTNTVTDTIRETAMLADITISIWSGSRTDNNLLEGVKRQHHATGNVGKVIKNLLPGADEPLKATRSAFMACRLKFYELTLPWPTDPHAARQSGPRLLPNALFNVFNTELAKLRRAALTQLEELCSQYPDLIAKGQQNLGTMASSADYPTVDELRDSFRISFDFTPIPDTASFKGLDEATLERLSARLARKQEVQLAEASKAMWQEAKKRIEHLVEKLTLRSPEGEAGPKFKSATVEHVRSLITLLPGWNIAGDPKISEVVEEIKELLRGVTAEELRKQPKARSDVARHARSVADKMSSWGV
jgi:hypothetical protein